MRPTFHAERIGLRTRAVAIASAMASAFLAGCSSEPRAFGVPVNGATVSIRSVLSANADGQVVLNGTMTQKCPVAGCWFILTDSSGVIKIDTKNAGFVVVDVPLNTKVVVSGRVVSNASERFVDASGMTF